MKFCVGLVLLLSASCSENQMTGEYPARPIEVIVPFAPGGGSDTFARLIKREIEEQGLLSYPLVIINTPGAGGTVGSRRVMNEASDGYTVLLLHDGILTAKRSGKTVYGPEVFDQVAGTGQTGTVIVVHEDSHYRSLSQLLAAAADHPDTVTFAANLGAPSHFVGLMLEQAHGVARFRFAQTGGGADRFAALKGQHATATALSLEEYLRFAPDGVRALAFMGDERHEQIPDVATAMEQGVPVRHSVMQYWWMPKGTAVDRRERFAQVLKQAMSSPRFQRQLTEMKIDPIYLHGKDLAAHLVESESALMRVDPGVETPLPNTPLALAVVAALLFCGLIATRFQASSDLQTNAARPTIQRESTLGPFAIGTSLLLLYAAATIGWEFPLGVATTLFVAAFGFVLAWRDRVLHRPLVVGTIAGFALALGIVFHFAFTELFEIGL